MRAPCIGADLRGGLSRLGLSQVEREARAYLREVARPAGLAPRVDPACNLLLSRSAPARGRRVLLVGSHTDSVRHGGWLDGAYGVVAAIEVLTVLVENAVDCGLEPVAVGFANEEGALVQNPFWGPARWPARWMAPRRPSTGTAAARARTWPRPAATRTGCPTPPWHPGSITGYLELHVEQGRVLEQRRLPIGVGDRIVGRSIFEIEVGGNSGHPGTTPMAERTDALTAAARLVLKVESISAKLGARATATVGYLDAWPNTGPSALLTGVEVLLNAVLAVLANGRR